MVNSNFLTFHNDLFGNVKGFVDSDGEIWFLAAQVCRCLGLKDSVNTVKKLKQRIQVVNEYSKGVPPRHPLLQPKNIKLQTAGGIQTVTVIPEYCLYELVFASRKQSAMVFRAWVTAEVLPELRKHGEYRMQGKVLRRELTDSIKTNVVDKTDNANAKKFAYSNYSTLVNKSLGLPSKVDRNALSAEMLEKIARKENLVSALLYENKSYAEIKSIIMA